MDTKIKKLDDKTWQIERDATPEGVEEVTEFIEDLLTQAGCSMKIQMKINVAIDELYSNIAKYAYAPETGPVILTIEIEKNPGEIRITLKDKGAPFDPLKVEEPDVTESADERAIGGLGIFLVRKTMDEVVYRFEDGCNVVTIVKKLA